MDPRGNLVIPDDLVHQDYKVLGDLQGEEVQEVQPVLWENLEIMGRMEKLVNQDFKVFLEGLDQWELQEIRVQLEIKDLRVPLGYQVHLEPEVILVKMVHQAEQDHLVNQGLQEKEVYLGHLVQEVSKECQAHLEKTELLEKMEKQACKVHLA